MVREIIESLKSINKEFKILYYTENTNKKQGLSFHPTVKPLSTIIIFFYPPLDARKIRSCFEGDSYLLLFLNKLHTVGSRGFTSLTGNI